MKEINKSAGWSSSETSAKHYNKLIVNESGSLSRTVCRRVKGALSGLRQLLAIKSPLKMMKNPFHFNSKALFDI